MVCSQSTQGPSYHTELELLMTSSKGSVNSQVIALITRLGDFLYKSPKSLAVTSSIFFVLIFSVEMKYTWSKSCHYISRIKDLNYKTTLRFKLWRTISFLSTWLNFSCLLSQGTLFECVKENWCSFETNFAMLRDGITTFQGGEGESVPIHRQW